MTNTYSVGMDSADNSNRAEVGSSQMVVQQYARYPSTLESTLQSASSLGSARSQMDTNKSPPLHRKGTPRSLQSSPRGIRSAVPASAARSGPSMSPPLFDAFRQQMKDTTDQAETRVLPARDITDPTIDDAYVLFIFYCNPNVPSSVDTSELRKTFRCPPRSDGKSFSVFTLFELIRKFDNKEIKTWIQLAIELGVEPPCVEKKQSTQKVQQYAVRLKRWMHAMHVDAFFEYCLGHPHAYYTQLPPNGPFISESRDGVPLEEDLALRALVPQWKPKRGRKRADEREIEEEKAAKRPSLDTSVGGLQPGGFQPHSVTFPQSAIPFSAFPEDEPWITASSSFAAPGVSDPQGQDLRWRLPEREGSPAGYPQSAIIPRGTQPSDALISDEPRSAVTPSTGEKNRARRKHGPAVSSAWPSSNGSSTGKSRGRPPNKPSTSGSFSSFQVNQNRESPQVPAYPVPQSSPLPGGHNGPPPIPNSDYTPSPTPTQHTRPGKLQLQVPQHMGAPVRLATPPTLLVNGVNGAVAPGPPNSQQRPPGPSIAPNTVNSSNNQSVPTATPRISIDDIVRVLSHELIRARLNGRPTPLTPDEATALASGMVMNLTTMYSQLPSDLSLFILALNLGVGSHFGLAPPNAASVTVNAEPSNTVIPGRASVSQDPLAGTRYNVIFEYRPSGHFSIQITLGHPPPGLPPVGSSHHPNTSNVPQHNAPGDNDPDLLDAEADDDEDDAPPVSDATWKHRYLRLRAQMQKKDRALAQYKRNIVDSVMADI
ncbi:hypothetical protein N7492_001973 [Penicillium capsulatum]|uniref:ARS binding protein Abp2 n=1 Tax=Penicillium capsulatum TaxID=69766 RepID=A0A9W9LUP0_9EURO|nr:hypothetical protein N7492_001973 [Penicillium capsulatum]KAJ6123408.1 hypothetical protein N7512_005873 [Penicillium capsulatum]